MIADMVTVFMNSARKNRANRIEQYSVWNPPTSSCSASTRSKGGRLSSAVPAITKITNGTTPVTMTFQRGKTPAKPSPAWLTTMSWVDSDPASRTTATTERPEGGLVGHHLRRGPHGAEQRVLRAGGPAGQHHAVDRDRAAGEDEQHADGRVGQLEQGLVAEELDRTLLLLVEHPADRDHREHEERGDQREEGGEDEHGPVGAVRDQVLLEEELDAVGEGLEDAERTGPVRSEPVATCRRGPCARTRS